MSFDLRNAGIGIALLAACSAMPVSGCGAAGSMTQSGPPVTVKLSLAKVTVSPGGMPASDLIFIASPSETALVSFSGLPGGVTVKYAASDTSPSGTLTFTAGNNAPAGNYTVKVTAMTAGQTASATFTLVVEE